MRGFAKRVLALPDGNAAQIIRQRIREKEAQEEHIVSMEIGTPNFDTPQYIKKAAIASLEQGDVFYCDTRGIEELRQAVSQKFARENGLSYSPDQILVTCGGTEGIFTILGTLCDPGDEVIFCDPLWDNYVGAATFWGIQLRYYHLKEEHNYEVDYDEVKSLVTDKTKLIVVITPNNPQGTIYSQASLEAIAKVAQEEDLLVLSDEIYDRIIYGEKKAVSIGTLPGMLERTITLNGMSKTFSMTGWRIGYLGAPPEVYHQLRKTHAQILASLPVFCQKGAAEALNNIDMYEATVSEMVADYKVRRDYLYEELNSIEGLSCRKPDGAFYVFLDIRGLGMTSEEGLLFLLEKAKVAGTGGVFYGDGTSDGYIRLCYAVDFSEIKRACAQIRQAVQELQR